MSKNYFAIERNGECWDHVVLNNENGNAIFSSFMDMTYDEMKSNENLEIFIVAIMKATNVVTNTDDSITIINLIGEDDIFIWGIMMGPREDGDINYALVDWKKDGMNYRYESENEDLTN